MNPGDAPFTVIVNGDNLTPDSEILFRGEPVETSYDATTGQLSAQIPEFDGNPPIQVSNAAISSSGLDGGISPPEYFFGTVKTKIVIKPDTKTKKFGEPIPEFTASVLVDVNGTLIADSLTLADVGLTNDPDGETVNGRALVPVVIEGPTADLTPVNLSGYILIPDTLGEPEL